jgi:hypothetical protein
MRQGRAGDLHGLGLHESRSARGLADCSASPASYFISAASDRCLKSIAFRRRAVSPLARQPVQRLACPHNNEPQFPSARPRSRQNALVHKNLQFSTKTHNNSPIPQHETSPTKLPTPTKCCTASPDRPGNRSEATIPPRSRSARSTIVPARGARRCGPVLCRRATPGWRERGDNAAPGAQDARRARAGPQRRAPRAKATTAAHRPTPERDETAQVSLVGLGQHENRSARVLADLHQPLRRRTSYGGFVPLPTCAGALTHYLRASRRSPVGVAVDVFVS